MKNEDFVTFEMAKKLKELGYDWKGYWFYRKDGLIGDEHPDIPSFASWQNYNDSEVAKHFDVECSAPTLAEAQKWLRDAKKTEVIVIRLDDGVYSYTIYGEIVNVTTEKTFDTYEKALSVGIDSALEQTSHNHILS